jgi:hypothetical protein
MLAGRSAIHLRTMTVTAITELRRERAYSPKGWIGRRMARAKALQLKIQALEAELSEHREVLLAHMQRHDLDRLELAGFTAVRKHRHNWSYSAVCDNLSLQLRQLQLDEQVLGVAQDKPKAYISLSAKA